MDATVCPVHGRRDQDGYFTREDARHCNEIVRKTFGGVPILCSKPLTETPADVLRSVVACFDEAGVFWPPPMHTLVERARRALEAEDG